MEKRAVRIVEGKSGLNPRRRPLVGRAAFSEGSGGSAWTVGSA